MIDMNQYLQLEFLSNAIKRMKENDDDDKKIIIAVQACIELSHKARKNGILSLENFHKLADETVPCMSFLKTIIKLLVDGNDVDLIQIIGFNRIICCQATGYEALIRIIYLEGVLCVQQKDNPLVVQMKLLSLLPNRIIKLYGNNLSKEQNDSAGEIFFSSLPKGEIFQL